MNKRKKEQNEVLENDLVSWLEEKFGHLKPYWSQITLAICAVAAIVIAAAFLWDRTRQAEAEKWQTLSYAQFNYARSMDNTSLADFADQYPDDPAGLWALLFAADAEVRAGLADFSSDRKAGFDKIGKGIQYYRRIIDSGASKSTMLQRRSLYGLAYALESNGEFEEATRLYQQIADLGDETPFAESVKRALERTTNDKYVALFEKFREYEDVPAEAPGVKLPQRPDISFPELSADRPDSGADQPDSGGGEFAGGNDDAAEQDTTAGADSNQSSDG